MKPCKHCVQLLHLTVLNCENWTTLCEKLTVYLSDPDPVFSVRKCHLKYKHFLFFPYHSRSKWNIIFF